jgi:predicted DNA-binding transcriptional regulator YafY
MSKSMAHESVARCLSLIPLIRENQGITLKELAQLSRTPEDQIADELSQVMLMCGVPPYFPHDYIAFSLHEDRVSIQFADQFRRPVSLNPLEALALKIACESLAPVGRPVPRAMAALLRKVEAAMSPEQRRQFRNLSKRVITREADDPASAMASRAALALAERRVIQLDYQAAGRNESKERLVEPYGLLHRDGRWYIVGQDRDRERIVHFRVDRVRNLKPTEDRFEIPPDFRLDQCGLNSLSDDELDRPRAQVLLRGPSSRWMREISPPGTLVDGEVENTVVWNPTIGSDSGLKSFVLGFGGEAEVLEPPDLRQKVMASLSVVLEDHESLPGSPARATHDRKADFSNLSPRPNERAFEA